LAVQYEIKSKPQLNTKEYIEQSATFVCLSVSLSCSFSISACLYFQLQHRLSVCNGLSVGSRFSPVCHYVHASGLYYRRNFVYLHDLTVVGRLYLNCTEPQTETPLAEVAHKLGQKERPAIPLISSSGLIPFH